MPRPGLSPPAINYELDHTRAYPHGPTAHYNLGPLRAHHKIKHHSRWRVTQPRPGMVEWTSPTGHTFTVEPTPRPPGRRDTPDQPDEPEPAAASAQLPEEPPF
ncbi:MAG: hypothetical protein ACRDVZ_10395 [Jiangellaceae bacterium]